MALAVSNEVVVIPVDTRRFDQCNSHLRRWAMRIQNTIRPNSQHLTRLKRIPKAIGVDLWTEVPVAVRITEVAPIVRTNRTRGARDYGGRGQQGNCNTWPQVEVQITAGFCQKLMLLTKKAPVHKDEGLYQH